MRNRTALRTLRSGVPLYTKSLIWKRSNPRLHTRVKLSPENKSAKEH